jgi:hexosaminidase
MLDIIKHAVLVGLISIFSCLGANWQERYPIIPKPIQVITKDGAFIAKDTVTIWLKPYNADTQELALSFAHFLAAAQLNVQTRDAEERLSNEEKGVYIVIAKDSGIEPEGYNLSITPETITIEAATSTGAFWGLQTLRQMTPADAVLAIPCGEIRDAPRFKYRGLHLDVARHMFPIAFIKKYLDLMAFYKLNTFHWHLTDDQGWRIEIKKYQKLQEISPFRKETLIGKGPPKGSNLPRKFDGIPYGGYYTQEEIKEVVEYARRRHITIVPEIELPGHSTAVLAAYPHLGCSGGPYEVGTRWGVFEEILCAGNDDSFAFLEDVFTEVLELFPGQYIHIGGDEAPKARWKDCSKCQERLRRENLRDEDALQSYFVKRIESFLNARGRQIIGWDEILEGGLAPNATVMSWRGIEGGIAAARLHHPVIMTPITHLYFDYYQSRSPNEPLAIRGYTTLRDVYHYEPIPAALNAEESRWIHGIQANVWTEYIQTAEYVEYMTYPRAIALAEIAWTSDTHKDFNEFLKRLRQNFEHLRRIGVNLAAHALEE